MKIVFIFLLSFQLISCFSQKMTFEIPSKKTIEVASPDYENYEATINNYSYAGIEIKVLNKRTNENLKGFGLGKLSKEKISLDSQSKLSLYNDSDSTVKVVVAFESSTPEKKVNKDKKNYITFILKNTSISSIPLIIPGVMNPNLSPFSESGVGLEIGQEIFFKENGKKYLLLKVDSTIEENSKLDVAKLLKNRKKELNL